MGAGSRKIAEFCGGKNIGVAVELGRKGEVCIVCVIVLMAFHMVDDG